MEPQQNNANPESTHVSRFNKEFHKWALEEANKVGSTVEESDMFIHNGIVNVRVINSLLVYKARFYAKLPILRISKAEFQASTFFQGLHSKYFPYDQTEVIEGQCVFYVYALMEEHTITTIGRTREKVPDYKDEGIMKKLAQLCPVFCKLVKFNFKNFVYELIKYPEVRFDVFQSLQGVWASQQQANVGALVKIEKPLNPNFNHLLKNNGTIEQIVQFSKRLPFIYNSCKFAIEQSVVYYVKEIFKPNSTIMSIIKTSKEEYFFPQGVNFEGLFLLSNSDQDSVLLQTKGKSMKQLLKLLFSKNLVSVRSLYNSTPLKSLSNIFRRVLVNNLKQSLSFLIPGDILYNKSSGKLHFAVYIGNGRILHTNFNLAVGEQELHSGKYFQVNGIECFVDMRKENILKLLRLRIGPFKKEQIESEAKAWTQKSVPFENVNRNYESLAFEVMAGQRFSKESGFLEESLEEFVDKVKMIEM